MQPASNLRFVKFVQAARTFALVVAFGCGVGPAYARDIYVSPKQGNDATGTGTGLAPYQTLQHALQEEVADCGDVIYLDRGVYQENIATKFDCESDEPLLITGPRAAIIVGADKNAVRPGRIFQVRHDQYHLEGFTIDGDAGGNCCSKKLLYVVPDDLQVDAYIEGDSEYDLASGDYVEGFSASKLMLRNAAEECLRLKFVTGAVVEKTVIRNCGVFGFENGRKNGEGIYIGTDSNQWPRRQDNPSVSLADESSGNLIQKNRIDGKGKGSECVDVKEGSTATLIERNSCTGQRDAESGGVSIQGNENVVRYNTISKNAGAGVRFGGNLGFGVDNDAYKNKIRKNQGYGMKIVATPQGAICDNKLLKNAAGDVNNGTGIDPSAPCP